MAKTLAIELATDKDGYLIDYPEQLVEADVDEIFLEWMEVKDGDDDWQ